MEIVFKNYPNLAKVKVTFYANRTDDTYGRSHQSTNGERTIAINVGKIQFEQEGVNERIRETILHEIQHDIQRVVADKSSNSSGIVLGGTNPTLIFDKLKGGKLKIYRSNGAELDLSTRSFRFENLKL
ncbi:hypothetical protein NZD85_11340 [Empedobacter stercoris]|uniref:hypothetical protein n=1 Tax=Empedobacter TaxID=59734 RepID=UPI0021B0684D|nr:MULTISPECIES: hypothetical protein [Empedobacter]MDM1543361.1 hypothetical protein [Empedobacter sp. 189-2]UWX66469.1 hypothetical protein NZD85_11340 [Empedobacter stercoris]